MEILTQHGFQPEAELNQQNEAMRQSQYNYYQNPDAQATT